LLLLLRPLHVQLFSTLTLRKAATALSFGIAALFLLLTGFVPRNNSAGHRNAVVFVTCAVAGLGVGTAGWDVNALGSGRMIGAAVGRGGRYCKAVHRPLSENKDAWSPTCSLPSEE
jgi:hypothetical protein